ncbi:hypothetical protein HDF17_000438 [Granulicella arctica]|uniref:Uncharacterized protein n=1 Tax=Granulicella arctica TaxID=940613 RepID=A0A7Y9PDY6_9BACT|nr:hypothetical protein [Granulicella arctica]
MRRYTKVLAAIACLVAILLVWGIYGLFHGYFDHGQFEVKQVQWSSSKQVAILAERSDQEALGGLTYFVVIGNHLLSPAKLRHAYYSNAVVFAATNTCLTLHWESPNRLVVACNGSYLDQEYIDVEKRQSGEIAISYVNISPNMAKHFAP